MTESKPRPPLRKVAELRTLYKLKPHFRDVIVEGRDDAAWINWYMGEIGAEHARAFAVDDRVEVPADLVSALSHEINARGRVLAIGHEAAAWADGHDLSLTCVIDSDFHVYDNREVPQCVLMTDFASMEVYSLQARPLTKFLALSAKADVSAEYLVSLLKPAWAALYALRYVLHNHADGARIVNRFAEKTVDSAGNIIFDAREMLRTAQPSPSRELLERLLELHSEYIDRIPKTSLDGIRGHDISPILIQFLQLKNDFAKVPIVEKLLRSSIELRDLDGANLFTQLKNRLA